MHAQPGVRIGERLVRWAFYGFVLSIPLDMPEQFAVELTTVSAFAFLCTTILAPRLCYGRLPGALFWFFAYPYAAVLAFAFGGGEFPLQVAFSLFRTVVLLMVFWAGFNLMQREGVAERAMLALVAGCVGVAYLYLRVEAEDVFHHPRILGQNANFTALNLLTGLLVTLGLTFGRIHSVVRPRLAALPVGALLLAALVHGGSRGGIVAAAAGLAMFAFAGRTPMARVRNLILTALGFVVLSFVIARSDMMRKRLESAQAGDLAGREDIWPAAIAMFKERPVFGWGPASNKQELAIRVEHQNFDSRDTHNLVLGLLTSTGLVGTVPFLIGMGLCFLAAWRARAGPQGVLPLALMAALLVASQAGNFIVTKILWLAMAYAAASGARVMSETRSADGLLPGARIPLSPTIPARRPAFRPVDWNRTA